MAFNIDIRTYDALTLALTKAICCSFLLTLIENNTVSFTHSAFDPEILEESRHSVLDWQHTELCTMQKLLQDL